MLSCSCWVIQRWVVLASLMQQQLFNKLWCMFRNIILLKLTQLACIGIITLQWSQNGCILFAFTDHVYLSCLHTTHVNRVGVGQHASPIIVTWAWALIGLICLWVLWGSIISTPSSALTDDKHMGWSRSCIWQNRRVCHDQYICRYLIDHWCTRHDVPSSLGWNSFLLLISSPIACLPWINRTSQRMDNSH